MARKPNYKFERMERDRAKVAKKAARLKAKQERSDLRKAGLEESGPPLDDWPEAAGGATDGELGQPDAGQPDASQPDASKPDD